jgi:hypothetical protein
MGPPRATSVAGSVEDGTKIRPFGMFFLPRRGYRIQPRVSTLGNIQKRRFALKGAGDHVGQRRPIATEKEKGIC